MGKKISDWDEFVKVSRNLFISTALKMRVNVEDAKDIVQTVYIKLIDKEYTPTAGNTIISSFTAVGVKAVKNEVINRHRMGKFKGRDKVIDSPDEYMDGLTAPIYTPYHEDDRVWKIIKATLTEKQFSLITAYAAGCSYKETASMHGISIGATKSLINRARTRLKELNLEL